MCAGTFRHIARLCVPHVYGTSFVLPSATLVLVKVLVRSNQAAGNGLRCAHVLACIYALMH